MKPLAFNLKDAKKIAGDKHSSTFHLKNGHKIMVAHAALPADQRKALEKMPTVRLMADGGDTSSNNTPVDNGDIHPLDAMNNASSQTQYDKDIASLPTSPDSDGSVNANAPTPSATDQTPADTSTASPAPTSPPDQPGSSAPNTTPGAPASTDFSPIGVYNTGMAGISAQQAAETQTGRDQLASNQDYQKELEAHNITYQAGIAAKNQEIDAVTQDIKNGHIDPNQYLENQDTGQKVSTAMGLLLGGWSSAYTHQGNPAMDFLNKQIDRNIAAQQVNLNQKKTLLGAYMDQTHNMAAAEAMTRASMYGNYALQFQDAALKSNDQMAQARALQASAAMKAKITPLIIASQQAQHLSNIQNATAAGVNGAPIDASIQSLINQKQMTGDAAGAKDLQDRWVHGVGLATKPIDPKDSQAMISLNDMDKNFGRAIQLQKSYGDTGAWSPSNRADANQIKNSLTVQLNQLNGLNRLNPQEYENFKDQIGNVGGVNMGGTLQSLKDIQLQLQNKKDSVYNFYGLHSPNAPAETKTVNGITYMRGPNGQAVRVK
jgi:hypothetical protein